MSGDLTNQEKLEEVYEMTMENNKILVSLRKQQRIANAFKLLYWIVILGALGGVYYYVRPTIDAISTNKDKIQQIFNEFNIFRSQLPEGKFIDGVLNNIKPTL